MHRNIGLACNLGAIAPSERETHKTLGKELVSGARERIPLEDGYAFRFEPEAFSQVAGFVDNERRCCPFVRFEIHLEAHQGGLWLYFRGDPEVRAFLDAAFGDGSIVFVEGAPHAQAV